MDYLVVYVYTRTTCFLDAEQITCVVRIIPTAVDQQCVCESVLGTLFDEMEDVLRE